MKRKQGISLIVLVITIIVMIILAASVVITLSNTGVINKASQAVQITDEKQIEQLANMAWADAYAGGKRTEQELKGAVEQVLTNNKVDLNKVAINVTEKGVEISDVTFEVYPLEVPFEVAPVIQLKAKIPVDYEDVYVEFTEAGSTIKVEKYDVEAGVRVFTYDMLPQCMGDIVSATLYAKHNDKQIIKTVESASVESYAKATLQKTAAELEMSENKFAKLKTLIADMLEYGTMCQIYRNYNKNNLVNAGVTGKSNFVQIPATDYVKEYSNSSESAKPYGNNFNFKHKLQLVVGFGGTNVDNISIKIIDGDNVITRIRKDFEQDKSNSSVYTASGEYIELTEYDKLYTIEEYNGDELFMKYKYSVKSYVYSKQNAVESDGVTLTATANVARTLYNYSLSARAYLAAK